MIEGSNPECVSVLPSVPPLICLSVPEPGADLDWLRNESFRRAAASPAAAGGSSGPPSPSLSPSPSRPKKKRPAAHRKHAKRRHHKRRAGSPAPPSGPPKPNTIWAEEAGLPAEEAHRTDHRRDGSNLHYDALYSGSVASYRRRFGWHTIGLGPGQELDWSDGRGRLPRKRAVKVPRYFQGVGGAGALILTAPSGLRSADRASHMETGDFLSLAAEKGLAVKEEGKGEEGEGEEGGLLSVQRYLSQRSADYNHRLLQQPQDVPLWLEFIAFQDSALQWGGVSDQGGGAGELSSRAKMACIERKLSIFERALESNPLSVELLLGQMLLATEVWPPEKLRRRWKDLVFRQPNQPRLWLAYVQFCRSQFTVFSAASLAALYSKALSTLSAIEEGTLRSHRPLPEGPRHRLSIFVLYCHFLRATGHSERAVALFQALLEFNLCCPAELAASERPMTERAEFFETFWDSGVARIGGGGAPGWRAWMAASQRGLRPASLAVVDPPAPRQSAAPEEEVGVAVDAEVALVMGQPPPTAWLLLERGRSRGESLPLGAVGAGPEDCSDPDRIVLFDDVRPALFRLAGAALQQEAVLSFLHFLGAPLCTPAPLALAPHHLPPCITDLHEAAPPFLPFPSHAYLATPLQPLGAGYGLLPLPSSLSEWAAAGPSPSPGWRSQDAASFVANVCSQTLGLLSDPEAQTAVAETWLAFELKSLHLEDEADGQTSRHRLRALQKLSKALLKMETHRNNLRLWNCCALLGLHLGGVAEATKVYQGVLSQYQRGGGAGEGGRAGEVSSELVLVHRCCAEISLGLRGPSHIPPSPASPSLALHTLVSLAEGSYLAPPPQCIPPVSPARVLKARGVFNRTVPEQLVGVHWVACHALFEYVSHGVRPACSVLDTSVAELCEQAGERPAGAGETARLQQALGDLLQLKVRLLSLHPLTQPLPPALLRSTLELALTHFPDNAGFLAAFTDSEQQSFISGRLRRWFDTHGPTCLSPLPWVYAVRAELQRHGRLVAAVEGGTGEVAEGVLHRVRAVLQRAAASASGRHCPLLWRLYIKFEVSSSV